MGKNRFPLIFLVLNLPNFVGPKSLTRKIESVKTEIFRKGKKIHLKNALPLSSHTLSNIAGKK
jgi:hypothetical protein